MIYCLNPFVPSSIRQEPDINVLSSFSAYILERCKMPSIYIPAVLAYSFMHTDLVKQMLFSLGIGAYPYIAYSVADIAIQALYRRYLKKFLLPLQLQ